MKKLPVSWHRQLIRLERAERRGERAPRGPRPLKRAGEALEEKVPAGLRQTLESAFRKAFGLLFGPGGTRVVEGTLPRGRLAREAGLWEGETPPEPEAARQALKRMTRKDRADRELAAWAAGAEGTALGLLGIGLPDIPVFLGLLLRGLYGSARRHGFSYESPEERCYLLLVLRGALAEGEERAVLSRRADRLGRALDHGWPAEHDLEAETDAASRALAGRLLTAKFVQGLPLVGAVGGAVNLTMYRRVSSYGARKYRKRFLERRAREAGRT